MRKITGLRLMVVGFATLAVLATFAGFRPAHAGGYDLREMTPAVQAALEARKDRFGEIKALKAQGLIGENNRGYVEALGGGAATEAIVAAENKDRKFVYQQIVAQNSLGAGALATVEKVFAGVQREKADAGEKIQDEQGDWQTK